MATPSHITNLRKVGGSVMLTVPPAILNSLEFEVGMPVSLQLEEGSKIVITAAKPKRRRKYTMDELLSQCIKDGKVTKAEKEWLHAPRVGREL